MFVTIIVFIAILAVLVLVHEFGHFYSARKLGVLVKEFGFGFPPRMFGIKKGETLYSINWLPLGGFVKLKGEQGEELNDPDSFASQKAWKRSIILVAGVFMNVVLCFVLLTTGFIAGLPTSVDSSNIGKARDVKIQIFGLVDNSPAIAAGVQPGDAVISIDGNYFSKIEEVQSYISSHDGQLLKFELARGQQVISKEITPGPLTAFKEQVGIGVSLVQTGIISYPWYEAIWQGVKSTGLLVYNIVDGFVSFFGQLFTTGQAPADVAGPVGIAMLTGQVVGLGWIYVLQFAALLSINLAIINILPFPALDGGRLLFVVIEKIRGKQANAKIEAIIHTIGFSFLMLLILVITYRDVVKIVGNWF